MSDRAADPKLLKFGSLATAIIQQKYGQYPTKEDRQTWPQIARRVAESVLKAVNAPQKLIDEVAYRITIRQIIPGGRYLYAAGRPYHQVQNCLLMRPEDSREGWSQTMQDSCMALMSGAGIGNEYSQIRPKGSLIRKTGGEATGPCALMKMCNEAGRYIMQGGSRRSAIWAGLGWDHADIFEFIHMKDWSPEVRAMKAKDYNFPADMDGTNVSVRLDDEFFKAYNDSQHPKHDLAQRVYWETIYQMLKTGEPGFSIDTGANAGETLRNACVPGETEILTSTGYVRIDTLVGKEVEVWNGFEFSKVTPKLIAESAKLIRVVLSTGQELVCTPDHEFAIAIDYNGGSRRVKALSLQKNDKLIKSFYPIIEGDLKLESPYTQGFIAADGMDNYTHFTLYEPKLECLEGLNVSHGEYDAKQNRLYCGLKFTPRHKTFVPREMFTIKSRIAWLSGLIDGDGTVLKEGGCQVASVDKAFLLRTQKMLTTLGVSSKVTLAREASIRFLPDGKGGEKEYPCQALYRLLIGAVEMGQLLKLGLKTYRIDFNGFYPNRNASQFAKVISVSDESKQAAVYCFNEPKRHLGCFEGIVTGQCTEITSYDDSDICNLLSLNLARIKTLEDMRICVRIGTAFLVAGTVYSDVPYAKVDEVRTKNRRLGLGLMGIHEWLVTNGKQYGPDDDLKKYMEIYETSTDVAHEYERLWNLSPSVKTRAIAPTGTIAILAETTSGCEPLFCAAYKRRYLNKTTWNYQYVIDPIANRLVEEGIKPEDIEDAYSLAETPERRIAFQAWLQKYVDHGISSTLNLPAWGSVFNNEDRVPEFGKMLMKYLPNLRGITVYPDGARSGQPLSVVSFKTAMKHKGEIFMEQGDVCDLTHGGSCGA
jgi:ribonucleotide reductase alpha subunit